VTLRIKRIYAAPAEDDGYRVLVDRVWPRGIRKEDAKIDLWLREIAPSAALRKWFGHDPAKWDEFTARYFRELQDHEVLIDQLRRKANEGTVTLLYGAKDEKHNQAAALKTYLDRKTFLENP
jgi:uncharacterized protein YeaO (DUF488 family)